MRHFSRIVFSAVAANAIAFSRPARAEFTDRHPERTLMSFNALKFSPAQPFTEAVQSRDVRTILPTTLSSAEIRDAIITNPALGQDIIDRATFSARMIYGEFLDEIDAISRDLLAGTIGKSEAERRLRAKLLEIGYVPNPEDVGTIKDFTTSDRLDLIINTNASIAFGYGQFTQGNQPGVLAAFPCQELFRLEHRNVERGTAKSKSTGWPERWKEAGGESYNGRMIARKDDPVWGNLGTMWNDSLGNPYPPFAFNSGMWVKDVRRSEAVQLGVIAQGDQVTPQSKGFNDDLKFTPKIRSQALMSALMESLGPEYQLKDGLLTKS